MTFKDPDRQELMSIDDAKNQIFTLFQKMSPLFKKDCMNSIDQIAETERVVCGLSDRRGRK